MGSSGELRTADEVMDALGGNAGVAELTGSTRKAVSNWRSFNGFPAKFYLVMTAALAGKGKRAPAALWGMSEPVSEAAQ